MQDTDVRCIVLVNLFPVSFRANAWEWFSLTCFIRYMTPARKTKRMSTLRMIRFSSSAVKVERKVAFASGSSRRCTTSPRATIPLLLLRDWTATLRSIATSGAAVDTSGTFESDIFTDCKGNIAGFTLLTEVQRCTLWSLVSKPNGSRQLYPTAISQGCYQWSNRRRFDDDFLSHIAYSTLCCETRRIREREVGAQLALNALLRC